MITLVNYGLGNIQALVDIYKRLNIPVIVAQDARQLLGAERIILPGVGAFDWAMSRLHASGMREVLDELVLARKTPVLGICVGMQMMARGSDEGRRPGLGWIAAEVRRLKVKDSDQRIQLPHMGWNDVEPRSTDSLFRDMGSPRFYFLHSYYFIPDDPAHTLATTTYHETFTSAVCSGRVFGTQFHPEKSHHWGMQLLKNFVDL